MRENAVHVGNLHELIDSSRSGMFSGKPAEVSRKKLCGRAKENDLTRTDSQARRKRERKRVPVF